MAAAFGTKKLSVAPTVTCRRMTTIPGGRKGPFAVISLPLILPVGLLLLNATALRVSSAYRVATGSFIWQSAGGQVAARNSTPINGDMIASGSGPGTLIVKVLNSDPLFSSAHGQDEVF